SFDDTGISNTDNITKNTTGLTITGSSEANAAIYVISDIDGSLGSTTSNGTGNWTLDVSLSQAIHTITATATDIAGNISGASTGLSITVDTSINAPTGLDLADVDDTGISNIDNITNNTSGLTIFGTAEADSAVELTSNVSGSLGSAKADGTGNWTMDVILTENVHSITATATDTAGNTSGASTGLSITVDTTENAPTGLDLADVDDSGISNTDNITNNTSGLTISGTSDANVTVSLTSDIDSNLGSTTSDGTGNWTMDVILTENVHLITATATDTAGNTSGASTGLSITVDTSINAPTGLDLADVDDSGTSNTDNITNKTSGLTISGTAEADSTVELTSNVSGWLGSAKADGTGNWTMDVILTENVHLITATATDTAGNISGASTGLSITVDTTENAPAGLDLDALDDSGISNIDNITNNTTGLTITGTSDANASIAVSSDFDSNLGSTTSDGAGNWTLDVILTENVHSITATATDKAGNISGASTGLSITVDTTSNMPIGLDLDALDDSGISNIDNITNNTTGLTITGTSDANASIAVSSNIDGNLGSTTSDGTGNWTMDVILTENVHSITATATDTAGNISGASTGLSITVDTSINAPTGLDLADVDDSGISNIDNITNNTTGLTITGTSDANASIAVSSDIDSNLGSTTSDGTGNWTMDVILTENVHSITATATDTAGNISGASTGLLITVDTTENAPTGLDLDALDDSGISNIDNITNNTTGLTITGTSDANASIAVSSDIDSNLGSTTSDGAGNWTLDVILTENVHLITATATDTAGNISGASTGLSITVDTTENAPAGLDLADVSDSGNLNIDNITNNTTVTLSGLSDADAAISITSDIDGPVGGVTADGTGNWSLDVTLSENIHSITATAEDTAGNISTASIPLGITVDISNPTVEPDILTADAFDSQVILGWNDPVDSDFNSIEITWSPGGAAANSVIAGVQTYTALSLTNDIAYTFTIKSVDLAGNKSSGAVIAASPITNLTAINNAYTNLTFTNFTYGGVDDQNNITLDFTVPITGNDGVEISWSSDDASISFLPDGTAIVTRPTVGGNVTVTLTATITKGAETTIKTFTVTVITNDTTAPGEITFQASSFGDGSISLNWIDPVDIDGDLDHLEITYLPGGSTPVTVAKGAQTKIFSGLTHNISYTFTVKTVDVAGNSSTGANITETAITNDGTDVDNDKVSLAITYASIDSALAVYQDLGLATFGLNGTTISWVATYTTGGADASAVVTSNGIITRPIATGDEEITLTATITKGSASDTKVFNIVIKQIMPPIKTYQNQCWNASGTLIFCAGTGQDGEYQRGRDVNFTGPTPHGTHTSDYTTKDNVTGLVWKSCSEGLSGAACTTGTVTTHTWDTANTTTCSALNSLNSGAGYAGINTWRLPNIDELKILINYSVLNPSSFAAAFPATVANYYWSSFTYVGGTSAAWGVNFDFGVAGFNGKTGSYYVRCVSTGSLDNSPVLEDNVDGTVTDYTTNLVWQKCSMGQTNDASCSGSATATTWLNAINYCEGLSLAGKSWRLPNVTELESIVDRTFFNSAIDTIFFPGTVANYYYSSSTYVGSTSYAWVVYFNFGSVISYTKTFSAYVRCVAN
ncbi:MAG: Ig-like domain-containing protein, partial [Spirochaetia bacterium]|nr:Ig-like domain-containing protein [Spirochaetia bacterium]